MSNFEISFLPQVRLWSEILTFFITTLQTFKQNKNFLVKVWIEFLHSVRTWLKMFLTHQFSMKKAILESHDFFGKLALKELFSWSIYTVKTSKLFFWLSCKSSSGKVVFLKNLFWKKSVSVSSLYNAAYFESKTSNASDLEPFFHNSTNLESKVLDCVRIRKKIYNASDFEVKLICKKKQILMKVLFCRFAFSRKPTIV